MSDIQGPTVKLGADASAVETAIQGVTGKFEVLGSAAEKTNSKLSGLGKNTGLDGVSTETEKGSDALGKLGDSADTAKTKLSGIASGFDLSKVADQVDKVSGKLKSLGATLSIAALPFEAYGAYATKAFADFEQGIGKIGTLLPDATKSDLDAIGAQLKGFSTQYGADISAAEQAYYDALSAGVSQNNALPFMETAQKAGVAGMSDVSVAVDGLTSILNSYQMKTEEAGKVSDTMFKTVELGKIEFNELATNIGKVAPTAAQFKVNFEDLGAAIAAITSQGLGPEQTMTVLTQLISQLGKSGTDLSDMFVDITGQTFPQFIASGGSLADAIGKIRDYSKSSGTALMDMTGNLEAAKALAMLGGPAFEQYADFVKEIGNSAGATDQAYAKMSDTMAFSMQQLKTQLHNTAIDVGEALSPSVKEFTKWLSDNSDNIKDFAVSVAQNAVPAIEKVFDILKSGMDAFNSMSPETKAFLSKMLGIGIVGTAAGGPALYGAGLALGPVSSLLNILNHIKGAGVATEVAGTTKAVSGLSGVLSSLSLPAAAIPGLNTALAGIGTTAETAAGAAGVGGLSAALVSLPAAAVVGGLLAAYATNFGDFRDNINNIFADIGSSISSISSGDFEGAGKDCAQAFADGLETVGDLVSTTIVSIPDALNGISSFNRELKSSAKEAARDFTSGFTSEIISESGNVQSAVQNMIHLALSPEAAQNEIPNAIRGWFSDIDLSPQGDVLAQSLITGITGGLISGLNADIFIGAIQGPIDSVADYLKQRLADSLKIDVSELNQYLRESDNPLGGYLAGAGTKAEKTTSYTDLGIEYAKSDKKGSSGVGMTQSAAEQSYWENRNAHSGGFHPAGENLSTPTPSQPAVDKAYTDWLSKNGFDDSAPKKALFAMTDEGKAANAKALTSNTEAINADTASTKSGTTEKSKVTDATKKAKLATDDLANSYKTIQEAMDSAAKDGKSSFKFNGTPYTKEWNEKAGKYEYTKNDLDSQSQRKRDEDATKLADQQKKDSDKQTEYLGKIYSANTKTTDALQDAVKNYGGINSALGKNFTVGDRTYKIAIDSSSGALKADAQSATALIEEGQQKSSETAAKAINTLTDANTKYQNQINKYQRSLSSAKSLDSYNDTINKINELQGKIDSNNTKLVSYQGQTSDTPSSLGNTSVDTTTKSLANLSNAAKTATKDTNQVADGIMRFSEPYKVGSESLVKSGNTVSASFQDLQNKEKMLQDAFKSGAISRDEYIEGTKQLSRDYDVVLTNTNKIKGSEKESANRWQKSAENLINEYNAGLISADDFTKKLQDIADKYLKVSDTTNKTVDNTTEQLSDATKAHKTKVFESIDKTTTDTKSTGDHTAAVETATKTVEGNQKAIQTTTDGVTKFGDTLVTVGSKIQEAIMGTSGETALTSNAEYLNQMDHSQSTEQYADAISEKVGQVFAREVEIQRQNGVSESEAYNKALLVAKGAYLQSMGLTAPPQGTGAYSEWVNENAGFGGGTMIEFFSSLEKYLRQVNSDIYSGKTTITATGKNVDKYGFAWGDEGKYKISGLPSVQSQNPQAAISGIDKYIDVLRSSGLSAEKAASMQGELNAVLQDNRVTTSEGVDYLGRYNQITGQVTEYTQGQISQSQALLSAIGEESVAQQKYSEYLANDGKISATEAADVNQRLAHINKLLGDAGITAEGGVSGLPGALQALGSYAQSAISQIQSALAAANSALGNINTAVASTASGSNSKGPVYNTVDLSHSTFSSDVDYNRTLLNSRNALIAGG